MTRNATDANLSRRGFVRAGATGAVAAAGVAAGSGSAAAQYDGWLDEVENYEGTHDLRGQEEVRVEVGAGENGLLFDPAAILIDEGTTVVWEWTGEGGQHNVAEVDGAFESELVQEAGHTFEYTFEDVSEGDTFQYVCEPHDAVEMKGAVAIGDVDDELVGGEDGGTGGRELATDDFAVLLLAFGFAGALLVPLFYAAHRKAQHAG